MRYALFLLFVWCANAHTAVVCCTAVRFWVQLSPLNIYGSYSYAYFTLSSIDATPRGALSPLQHALAIARMYFLLAFRAYFDWRTLQLCSGHTVQRRLPRLATAFVAATAAAAVKANFNEANKFSLMSTANRFANLKELLQLKAL